MLYTFFVTMGALLSIHLISTAAERLFIFTALVLLIFQASKHLALVKNKKLVSLLFAGTITILISSFLKKSVLGNFPVLFIVFVLILFLSGVRLPFTRRKKLVAAVLAGLITMSISAAALSDLHRSIFPDKAVTKFAQGGFNGLALDTDNHVLYSVGHEANHFVSFNIDALETPPKLSDAETGPAKTFFYNDRLKEIYNYNKIKRQLDILDSADLTIKKSIPIHFPPGFDFDTWTEMDPHTGYIIVAAVPRSKEFDRATVIVSRTDGKIVKELPFAPMNIIVNPSRPLLYLSWWQHKKNEIVAYDLEKMEISRRVLMDERMDRMAFLEPAGDLLVTIPLKSMVYRLDPETLEIKGRIRSSLGVRTLAVDAKRNLLLTLSLVSGMLDVIDLSTDKSLKKYYLAPWLRSIVLDGNGTAYVSSFTGLFRVKYAD